MKTLILFLSLLLIPAAGWAGDFPFMGGDVMYNPVTPHVIISSCTLVLTPSYNAEISRDTETLAVWDNGKLAIQRGACEKLGLAHAWKMTHDMNCKCPYVHLICENCGKEKQILKTEYK